MHMKKISTKRILVADDDPAIVDSIQLMLEAVGYEVDTTVNGDTVKDLIENFPHLLLLDIWMSGLFGTEICSQLKDSDKTKHIPVIMMSAHPGAEKSVEEIKADAFLAKPFDIEDLLKHIKKLT